MAKLEQTLNGDFNQWLHIIEDGILNGSMSASLEESSDFRSGDARCSVRVFERYSYAGGNRVSLSVALDENIKMYPEFFRTELKNPTDTVKHFIKDER